MSSGPSTASLYHLEPLISRDIQRRSASRGQASGAAQICCAQALGSEIYVGCSNGELLRYALQANDPNKPASYIILSQQVCPTGKGVDELVLAPSISRVFVLSDHQLHFYTLPALDRIPPEVIRPIRGVDMFAVDYLHLRKPPADVSAPLRAAEPVPFCVIKGAKISLYTLRERLQHIKDVAFLSPVCLARQTGQFLCVADKSNERNYNVIDLRSESTIPLLPVSRDPEATVKPSITVVDDNQFLLLSWNGDSAVGLFVTGGGDPVSAPLEWPVYPESVCVDHPYIIILLPDCSIEVRNIGDHEIVQNIPPASASMLQSKLNLSSCLSGYFVPSPQRSDSMRMTPFSLLRTPAANAPASGEAKQEIDQI